jgi:hypothetical protein
VERELVEDAVELRRALGAVRAQELHDRLVIGVSFTGNGRRLCLVRGRDDALGAAVTCSVDDDEERLAFSTT